MKKTILSAAVLSLALMGCSNSEEGSQSTYVPEGTPIRVNALVGDMETRAGNDSENLQRFYLNIVNSNKKPNYCYNALMVKNSSGAWESFDANDEAKALRMYWAGDEKQVEVTAATFAASEMSGLGVESDQTSEANYNKSDKLVMKPTSVNPDPTGITVNFEHLMAKVKLEIDLGEEDNFQTNPLANVAIGGTELKRVCAETTYTFTDLTPSTVEEISPLVDGFTAADNTESPTVKAMACYEAIVVPQTVGVGKFTVSFTLGGKNYIWSSSTEVVFDSNFEYTLKLKLYPDKLVLDGVTVDGWGSQEGLGSGAVVEYIPTLTVTADDHLENVDEVTKALRGGTKLNVVGPLNENDAKLLGSAGAITYLDLTDAEFDASYLSSLFYDSDNSQATALAGTLEAFIMPKAITALSSWSFLGNCSALKNLTLPAGLTSIQQMGSYLNKTAITEITIPAGVTTIGYSTFGGCSKLKKVTLKGNVTSIGMYAFDGCSALTELNLPEGLTSIGENAFQGCSALEEVNLPSTLTSIEIYAFQECSALKEVTIPSKITSLSGYVFYGCTSLETVNLPEGLTSIGMKTFFGCSALKNINLPLTLTSIDLTAFEGCSAITEITLLSKNTNLAQAFSECTNLKKVNLPDGLTEIANYSFQYFKALAGITIPSTVTKLGTRAFGNCEVLTAIELPAGLTEINYGTFYGCKALTTITLHSGVTTIPNLCFWGCTELTTVTCEGKIGTIGQNAFMNCTKLTDLYLKDCESLPSLGDNVFYGIDHTVTVHLSEELYNSVTGASTTWSGVTFTND